MKRIIVLSVISSMLFLGAPATYAQSGTASADQETDAAAKALEAKPAAGQVGGAGAGASGGAGGAGAGAGAGAGGAAGAGAAGAGAVGAGAVGAGGIGIAAGIAAGVAAIAGVAAVASSSDDEGPAPSTTAHSHH